VRWLDGQNHLCGSSIFEEIMIKTQYTAEDLKKLPLRAIVAFAARCARRVESIAQFPADHPQREARRVAIDDAIRLAEEIARGSDCASIEPVLQALEATRAISGAGVGCDSAAASAAAAARTAATVRLMLSPGEGDPDADRWTNTSEARSFLSRLEKDTAEIVALNAFTTAVEAADAVAFDDAFMRGAIHDYERLLGLYLGSYPHAGQSIEPSPDGPLGPL
jgi:hypothetical protein